jgi:hypothetical protein
MDGADRENKQGARVTGYCERISRPRCIRASVCVLHAVRSRMFTPRRHSLAAYSGVGAQNGKGTELKPLAFGK